MHTAAEESGPQDFKFSSREGRDTVAAWSDITRMAAAVSRMYRYRDDVSRQMLHPEYRRSGTGDAFFECSCCLRAEPRRPRLETQ